MKVYLTQHEGSVVAIRADSREAALKMISADLDQNVKDLSKENGDAMGVPAEAGVYAGAVPWWEKGPTNLLGELLV
jgi:hypothetical protein